MSAATCSQCEAPATRYANVRMRRVFYCADHAGEAPGATYSVGQAAGGRWSA